jgi:hypothetical protein
MVALGGTGDQVRATEFIGQSSGILLRLFFDTLVSVFSRVKNISSLLQYDHNI